MDWIHVAQHRDYRLALVITVMYLRVQQIAHNFLSSCATISF
jgi:hypothetical protein